MMPTGRSEQVLCQVPANSLYLAIIRCAVSAMATHLNMRLDDMEDLRRAVDEACIALMRDAIEGSDLTCLLQSVDDDTVQVSVRAFTKSEPAVGPGTPSWWVLRRFGDIVETSCDDHGLTTICVTKRRSTAGV